MSTHPIKSWETSQTLHSASFHFHVREDLANSNMCLERQRFPPMNLTFPEVSPHCPPTWPPGPPGDFSTTTVRCNYRCSPVFLHCSEVLGCRTCPLHPGGAFSKKSADRMSLKLKRKQCFCKYCLGRAPRRQQKRRFRAQGQ